MMTPSTSTQSPILPAAELPVSAMPPLPVMSQSKPIRSARIVGESESMAQLLVEVRRLALTDAKVLITGESGVGKELIASHVHTCSRRVRRPFVAVNCAGLSETLLESELFGHVKGSFTGAYRDKPGKFEMAHTGTLFLDEVGEMTLRMQGLLLRVLETGELQKVGADRWTGRVDTRVVAATNRNLPEMIRQGLFRLDLYYRLNVIHVHVPPLRERPEDIRLLADFFLDRLAKDAQVSCRFAPDFYDALQTYDWPGNVRQLDNVIQRLFINCRNGVITAADLPGEVRTPETATGAPSALPRQERRRTDRRRTLGESLYERIQAGTSFWTVVYEPFIRREITKAAVRAVVQKGLEQATGNYRVVTGLFHIAPTDYKRFLNFLRKHECLLPYRDYR